jgi:hypothetical protein
MIGVRWIDRDAADEALGLGSRVNALKKHTGRTILKYSPSTCRTKLWIGYHAESTVVTVELTISKR